MSLPGGWVLGGSCGDDERLRRGWAHGKAGLTKRAAGCRRLELRRQRVCLNKVARLARVRSSPDAPFVLPFCARCDAAFLLSLP